MAASVSPLGPHQGDKVQGVQINLKELLEVIRLNWDLWTPSPITLF